MATPIIHSITLAIKLALGDFESKPENQTAFIGYFESAEVPEPIWEAGWSSQANDCPTNFYVLTKLAPVITQTNGWFTITFQE